VLLVVELEVEEEDDFVVELLVLLIKAVDDGLVCLDVEEEDVNCWVDCGWVGFVERIVEIVE
jgi:hypothetical protein